MLTAGVYPITIRRGDTGTWQFTLTSNDTSNPNEPVTPVDITNWKFTGVAKHDQTNNFFVLPIEKVNPLLGQIRFYVGKEVSENIVPVNSVGADSAKYEIQVSIPNGDRTEVVTIMEGTLTIVRDLVRESDIESIMSVQTVNSEPWVETDCGIIGTHDHQSCWDKV